MDFKLSVLWYLNLDVPKIPSDARVVRYIIFGCCLFALLTHLWIYEIASGECQTHAAASGRAVTKSKHTYIIMNALLR